jgi:hypothetical protein
MTKIFESLNATKIEKELDEFEKSHIVTEKQYMPCYYKSDYTAKVWHCVMVTYQNIEPKQPKQPLPF